MRSFSYIPLLVVGDPSEAAETLESGVDSFVAAPPDLRELKARINSLLRRKRNNPPPGRNGGASNNSSSSNSPTKLTPTESRVENFLRYHEGHLQDYQSITKFVWGNREVSLDTLHYYIRRVQAKMSSCRIIQNRGVGYLLS